MSLLSTRASFSTLAKKALGWWGQGVAPKLAILPDYETRYNAALWDRWNEALEKKGYKAERVLEAWIKDFGARGAADGYLDACKISLIIPEARSLHDKAALIWIAEAAQSLAFFKTRAQQSGYAIDWGLRVQAYGMMAHLPFTTEAGQHCREDVIAKWRDEVGELYGAAPMTGFRAACYGTVTMSRGSGYFNNYSPLSKLAAPLAMEWLEACEDTGEAITRAAECLRWAKSGIEKDSSDSAFYNEVIEQLAPRVMALVPCVLPKDKENALKEIVACTDPESELGKEARAEYRAVQVLTAHGHAPVRRKSPFVKTL